MFLDFTDKIFSVSEINSLSRDLLEKAFSSVRIAGEVSNFKLHSSGHMYFSLKDENAVIDAVMYGSRNRHLDFTPERGVGVIASGKVSIYTRGGRFQLVVWSMEEAGTGKLEKKFIDLKNRLSKEGVFDEAVKKAIPPIPATIGVVTSPTGAAIRDIINVINRRFANVSILIYPVKVQGVSAASEIAEAINILNIHRPDMDVMIVGRGGGSLEDLWPFNEEGVARAIFESKIPVISAVGHETDITISDFAADLRAPTPSAAAELVVRDKTEAVAKLGRLFAAVLNAAKHRFEIAFHRLNTAVTRDVFRFPERILEQKAQAIDHASAGIPGRLEHLLEMASQQLAGKTAVLESLSPETTLKRGFSITYVKDTGRAVNSSAKLKKGDLIVTRLYKGSAESRVETLK